MRMVKCGRCWRAIGGVLQFKNWQLEWINQHQFISTHLCECVRKFLFLVSSYSFFPLDCCYCCCCANCCVFTFPLSLACPWTIWCALCVYTILFSAFPFTHAYDNQSTHRPKYMYVWKCVFVCENRLNQFFLSLSLVVASSFGSCTLCV